MASLLDRLIDKACGVEPGDFITLRCPDCKEEKRARRDKSDLDGTAVVEARCPECCGNERDEVLYFDADGKQLGLDQMGGA